MGLRGPKSVEELIAIEDRRRRSAENGAPTSRDPPPPPAHLSADAKARWNWYAPLIEDHQLDTLQLALECWDQKTAAREDIEQNGLTYTDDRGKRFQRPEVTVERNAMTGYLRAMHALRLDVPPPKPKKPPIDRNASLGISWRDRVED